MRRYYTSACNFYYGKYSKFLVNKREALPLHGKNNISFSHIKIIARNSEKIISIKKIDSSYFPLINIKLILDHLDLSSTSGNMKNRGL